MDTFRVNSIAMTFVISYNPLHIAYSGEFPWNEQGAVLESGRLAKHFSSSRQTEDNQQLRAELRRG